MLNRILHWVADSHIDRTTREQANHVKGIARTFRLSVFPEILTDVQDCSVCKKSTLVLVHPDMLCYSCFIDACNVAHNDFKTRA